MGNDGGSIPRRNEMVKEKQKTKDNKEDLNNQLIALYYFCALSKRPLQEPVVGDGLGRLFNREAILEYLLDKKNAFGDGPIICNNINSIKDVKALNVKPNPSYTRSEKPDDLNNQHHRPAPFICPITSREMNGHHPFEFIWGCGCVYSVKARKELPNQSTCLVCGKPFDDEDVIPIHPQDSKVTDGLREKMADRRKTQKNAKTKKKKRKLDNDIASRSDKVQKKIPNVS